MASSPAIQTSSAESITLQQLTQQTLGSVRDFASPPASTQQPILSLNDLRAVAADIKDTLTAASSAAIADLRQDIQEIAHKVQEVETMRHK